MMVYQKMKLKIGHLEFFFVQENGELSAQILSEDHQVLATDVKAFCESSSPDSYGM
jgi:hypothetical protein